MFFIFIFFYNLLGPSVMLLLQGWLGLFFCLCIVVQHMCSGVEGGPCECKMSPLEEDFHLQCPAYGGQSCSREGRSTTCFSWTKA